MALILILVLFLKQQLLIVLFPLKQFRKPINYYHDMDLTSAINVYTLNWLNVVQPLLLCMRYNSQFIYKDSEFDSTEYTKL